MLAKSRSRGRRSGLDLERLRAQADSAAVARRVERVERGQAGPTGSTGRTGRDVWVSYMGRGASDRVKYHQVEVPCV